MEFAELCFGSNIYKVCALVQTLLEEADAAIRKAMRTLRQGPWSQERKSWVCRKAGVELVCSCGGKIRPWGPQPSNLGSFLLTPAFLGGVLEFCIPSCPPCSAESPLCCLVLQALSTWSFSLTHHLLFSPQSHFPALFLFSPLAWHILESRNSWV